MTDNHHTADTHSKTAVEPSGGKDDLKDTQPSGLPLAEPQGQNERVVMVTPTFSDVPKWEVTSWGKSKEMQLTATAPIEADEFILTERPLVFAHQDEHPCGYTWALVDKILSSTSLMEAYYSWRLKATKTAYDAADSGAEKELARKHRRTREMVCSLYYSVATNNFTCFSTDDHLESYGLYRVLSRVNHSCEPNALVATLDASRQEMVLIATKPIATGEAITWSYLGTSQRFMNGSYEERNRRLFNQYRFVCRCERCLADIPAQLKNHPYLPRYFDGLLREEAIRLFRAGQQQH